MSIRNIGFSVAMTTVTLLSGISAASANTWSGHRQGDWNHHRHDRQQQCFHRYDGIRCFWR